MGKTVLIDYDSAGELPDLQNVDFWHYATENMMSLRKLRLKYKGSQSVVAVPMSELSTNVKRKADVIWTGKTLSRFLQAYALSHPEVEQVMSTSTFDDSCTLDGFIKYPDRLTRDYSRMELRDHTVKFSIVEEHLNDLLGDANLENERQDDIIIYTFCESQNDVPKVPLVSMMHPEIHFVCIALDESIVVPEPWQKYYPEKWIDEIMKLPKKLQKLYIKYNLDIVRSFPGYGELKEFSIEYGCCIYVWIDTSVKIVGDLKSFLLNEVAEASADTFAVTDEKYDSIWTRLNGVEPKYRNAWLKSLLSGSSNVGFKEDFLDKNVEQFLRISPLFSTKFMITNFRSTFEILWMNCLQFPEIPDDVLFSMLQYQRENESLTITPAQVLRRLLII